MSDTSPSPASAPPPSARRRTALIRAGVAAVVIVVAGAWAVARASGGGEGCMSGLLDRLPEDVTAVDGADLDGARAAGYDDSDDEALRQSAFELGAGPDRITSHVLVERRGDDELPYAPADVDCWVTDLQGVAARGSFDEDAVEASDVAEMTVDGDVLTSDLDGATSDAAPAVLEHVVDVLEQQDAVLIRLAALTDDGRSGAWSGVALAPGDPWDLIVVWARADADAASEAEARVRDVLDSDSIIPDLIEGDAGDALERDGAVLMLRAPLAGGPADWTTPMTVLDEALVIDLDDD